MTALNSTTSVFNHSEWPATLERIHQYLQALEIPVSQQTQVLSDVIAILDTREINGSLCVHALTHLRKVLAGNESSFSQAVVSTHYGFAEHRDLEKRQWSMPSMRRSAMTPQRQTDSSATHWGNHSLQTDNA